MKKLLLGLGLLAVLGVSANIQSSSKWLGTINGQGNSGWWAISTTNSDCRTFCRSLKYHLFLGPQTIKINGKMTNACLCSVINDGPGEPNMPSSLGEPNMPSSLGEPSMPRNNVMPRNHSNPRNSENNPGEPSMPRNNVMPRNHSNPRNSENNLGEPSMPRNNVIMPRNPENNPGEFDNYDEDYKI